MPTAVRWWSRAAGVGIAVTAFALAITKIDDPDAWMHLALGRDLVARGHFPAHESFPYPSTGLPYWNLEWLFQIFLYGAYALAGIAGVILLTAAIVAGAAAVLWKVTNAGIAGSRDPWLRLLLQVALVLAALLLLRHRFVERPDLALMIFLPLTIYALERYVEAGRPYVFFLPLLQLVWANVHPSAAVGAVPFVAVLAGAAVLRLVRACGVRVQTVLPSARRLAGVAVVLVAFLLASLLNPHGVDALRLPLYLAALPWQMHEITELQPVAFAQTPQPWLLVGLLAVSFVVAVRRWPVVSLLLALPFAYLGLSFRRGVFLLVVVAVPIIVRNLDVGVPARGGWASRLAYGIVGAGAIAAAVFVAQTFTHAAPFEDLRHEAGIGVNTRLVPEGALRYLDRNALEGRLFNTFYWGGYITWRDFPRRVVIADGRGYLPPGLMEQVHFARHSPSVLARLQTVYGFDVAVVDYPLQTPNDDGAGDADQGLSSPAWALVYWDDLALVYVRRTERLAALIARDEYRLVKPANGILAVARFATDPRKAESADAELNRNVAETGSARAHLLRGFLALGQRDWQRAAAELGRVPDDEPLLRLDALQGRAMAAWRQGDRRAALAYYRGIVTAGNVPAWILYNIGLLYTEMRNDAEAVRYFERARVKDRSFLPVYPALLQAYGRLGDDERRTALAPDLLAATLHDEAEKRIRRALVLSREQKLAEAEQELRAAVHVDFAHARGLIDLGYVHLYQKRARDAVADLKMALAIEPRSPAAHWGLALAYRALGDEAAARAEFAEYVRLEPWTYAAWQVRQGLARPP